MKNIWSMSVNFYQKNGLLGVGLSKIFELRGGEDSPKMAHFGLKDSSARSEQIDEILKEDKIAERYKKPLRILREDSIFTDSEKLKLERLCNSLIAKTKYPIYSSIKSKLPYVILTPFTFVELSRLAVYRIAGLTSAPLTMGAFIGFSMPCAVTFSMLEMYVPEKFKFPCKCVKWSGGIFFYGVCSSLDYVTAGLENKFFGEELSIDAPQLMGTLPKMEDLKELKNMKKLADSLMYKAEFLGED